MQMVIVGGGKAGWNLARALLERRHSVTLVEKDRARCRELADALDAAIYPGDGTHVPVLEAAGTYGADCVMAVTGVDQDNLVCAQLAQNHFGAKKVIVRVNDPRNVGTFRALGIHNIVSSTDILTKMIEQEADMAHMHLIASLNKGKGEISSITLSPDTAWAGVRLMDMKLPKGALVISVIRQGEMTIPNGATVLNPGDELVAVSEERSQKALRRVLSETK